MGEEIAGYAAKHPFTNAGMPVRSDDDEVGTLLFSHQDEFVRR